MTRRRLGRVVPRVFLRMFLASLLLSGCDGEKRPPPEIPRDGGTPGITVPGPTLTNTPQATFWVTTSEEAADLELLSSNLLPDPSSTVNFLEWYGEVRNNGSTAACYVQLTLDFRAASGARVESLRQFATAAPYKTEKVNVPIVCIPPGEIGSFYANDLPAEPVQLSSIALIDARLSLSSVYPDAVPYPSKPKLNGVALIADPTKGAGYWIVAGTLTATAAIGEIAITAFYKDAAGLTFGRESVNSRDTLAAGQSRDFKTFYLYGPQPSSYRLYISYLLAR